MEVIDTIPLALDPADVVRQLRFDPVRAGFDSLDELLSRAAALIHLRAVCDTAYIGAKGEDTVEIGGVKFRSRVLRMNLDQAQKVFPFIVTAGPDLEAEASASGDMLKQYYLEEIANMALSAAAAWLSERLRSRWGLPGLAAMDPGSIEDWPITEQPKLFSLFGDTEKLIGVRLTDSLLMVPRKSISGILFPSEEGFQSCQLCERADCPGRRVPYDASLAAAYSKNG
jgi:Vitamin B12 dependent methionine synthase, activation domain